MWRKVLLIVLCLIIVVIPVVHAFAFVPFLAAPLFAGSSLTVGHALLGSLVIAMGAYIGYYHKDDIDYIVQSTRDGLTGLWNSLSPSQRDELTAAGQASYSGQAATANLSADTMSKIYDFAAQTFHFVPKTAITSKYPILANLPMYDRGALYECTSSDYACYKSYVDRGIAHKLTDSLYMIPYYVVWDSGGNITTFEAETIDIVNERMGMQAPFYTADTNFYGFRVLSSSFYNGIEMSSGWIGTSLQRAQFGVQTGIKLEYVIPTVLAQLDSVVIPRVANPAIPVPVDFPKKPKDVALPIPPDVVIPGQAEGTFDISVPVAQTIAESIPAEGSIDEPIDPPANPPIDFTPPTTGGLDFSKLLMAGQLLKEKFPFSIPWDLKNQLNVFNVTPQAPVIHVYVPNFVNVAGHSYTLNFTINLSQFDKIAQLTRWFVTLLVDIGFILMIRRLMPE